MKDDPLKTIEVKSTNPNKSVMCTECNGQGYTFCPRCGGYGGMALDTGGIGYIVPDCDECDSDQNYSVDCSNCGGTGWISYNETTSKLAKPV